MNREKIENKVANILINHLNLLDSKMVDTVSKLCANQFIYIEHLKEIQPSWKLNKGYLEKYEKLVIPIIYRIYKKLNEFPNLKIHAMIDPITQHKDITFYAITRKFGTIKDFPECDGDLVCGNFAYRMHEEVEWCADFAEKFCSFWETKMNDYINKGYDDINLYLYYFELRPLLPTENGEKQNRIVARYNCVAEKKYE